MTRDDYLLPQKEQIKLKVLEILRTYDKFYGKEKCVSYKQLYIHIIKKIYPINYFDTQKILNEMLEEENIKLVENTVWIDFLYILNEEKR